MNKAEEFHQKIMQMVKQYDPKKLYKNTKYFKPGSDYDKEIHRSFKNDPTCHIGPDQYQCWFYWYLACATKYLQPKAVVEIGADEGTSALAFLTELPEDGKVYSIDIRDGWEAVPKTEKRLIKILGNSIDDEIVNKYDYSKATLWLIDGFHTGFGVVVI